MQFTTGMHSIPPERKFSLSVGAKNLVNYGIPEPTPPQIGVREGNMTEQY